MKISPEFNHLPPTKPEIALATLLTQVAREAAKGPRPCP
jgi:hypothetical protein